MKLILKDGTEITGDSFGAETSVAGEVVFNTAMTGYPESLTDPSYKGQILVLTFPLIGNYGVPGKEMEDDLLKFFESETIQIAGLIVQNYSGEYSHWNAKQSLGDWLKEHNIPAICNVDTRMLTKKIREEGAILGKLEYDNQKVDFHDPNQDNLVDEVSCKEVIKYGSGDTKIVLVDCGVKYNIIRCLIKRGVEVIRVPWNYDYTQLEYDGLFISNGPGNPEMCDVTINNLKKSIQEEKPIFGICLGNQLLGLASGGSTYKLKYGHRSHNQPAMDLRNKRCYITSQNHGYALDGESLNENWEVLFKNLNDNTCEGIKHKTKPIFSVQFHPEATSGPVDTEYLFDDFLKNVEKFKK
ncbi:MAG: glutamine-hydrolyzing carbamoyl-phosphate synthase small subunit [Flavobacteriales bacterium]|nr:glutamine-hydrolyzing carbamoyl-phosphate synthase small subunit [Flavobacteriales bacterium]